MKFSVIIPVFNRPAYTQACIESLLATASPDCEIIVVDNGSLPQTRLVLEMFGSRIKVIRNDENKGTAGGYNAGMAAASNDLMVLMHNDCIVPKGWESAMRVCAEMMSSSIVKVLTPMTNYSDEGTFLFSKDLQRSFLKYKLNNKQEPTVSEVFDIVANTYADLGGLDEFSRTPVARTGECREISSFCMVLQKSTIGEVGGFDESFKGRGHEEKEFLLRLRMKGYAPGIAPFFIHHFCNITSDGPDSSCHAMKERNEPVYASLARMYSAVEPIISHRKFSCIVYPDVRPDFTPRVLRNLGELTWKPEKIIQIPSPGIFPEREALKWALPQVTTDFVSLVDSDFLLNKNMPEVMMSYFSDPKVGCVAAYLRCQINGVTGFARIWRTEILKKITFSDGAIRDILPDTDYTNECERLGFKFLRIKDVVGDHAISMDPWNIFKIYFRIGVKQRARGRVGTSCQLWGVDGAMKTNTPWSHLALFAYHCGIQVDDSSDPHTKRWEDFAYEHYAKVKPFCEALVSSVMAHVPASVQTRKKIKVMLAAPTFLKGGCEQTMLNMSLHLDQEKFETIIAYESESDPCFMKTATDAGVPIIEVGIGESRWMRVLVTERPDVIVTFLHTGVFGPARHLGIPLVERTPGWNGHSGVTKDNFERVVCEYEGFRKELLAKQEFKAIPEKTDVLYNGVDLSRFKKMPIAEARAITGIRQSAFAMVCVARTHPVKNLSLQVKALKLVLENGVDAELHFVGRHSREIEAKEKSSLDVLVRDLGLSSRVFFHGMSDNPVDFFNSADVVTLSSKDEGASNVLVEAMALEKPIVTTDVGGLREITEGLARYAGTPEEFANAIIDGMSTKSVTYPSLNKRFSMSSYAGRWRGILEEVYLKYNDKLPYVAENKINVALLCESLDIGGMETFAKIFDTLADRSRFNVFIYSHLGGEMEAVLRSKVRLCPGPWEAADHAMAEWLRSDEIDVAIVVTYSRAANVFSLCKPCRVIERLDGTHVDLIKDRGTADVVVFQSATLAEQQRENYPGMRHETIFNGREVERFGRDDALRRAFRSRHGLSGGTVVIAAIGRIHPIKNFNQLVGLAEDLLRDGHDNFQIILMGNDQGAKPSIESKIREMKMERWITIVDGSTDGPPRLLSAADIFVHPSTREGLAGVLIEAAAAGLPIVATDVGAAREIVGDDNGFVVPVGDRPAMRDAVASLIKSPELRMQLGSASLSKSKRFSADEMIHAYEAIISEQAMIKREDERTRPIVTVLMPIYDRVDYFDAAIKSIINQTCKEWRLLIAIDTLTPSQEILDVIASNPDPRITYTTSPHLNQCSALNHGVRQVKTPYTVRLDSDDMLSENAIAVIVEAIRNNPKVGYFYASRLYVDSIGNPISINGYPPIRIAEDFSETRLEEWNIAQPGVVWRNEDFLKAGGFAEDVPYGEDYLLPLIMMLHGTKFMAIKEPLYVLRTHSSGNICSRTGRSEQEHFIQAVRERYVRMKRIMGISWAGEDCGKMQQRKRIREGQ